MSKQGQESGRGGEMWNVLEFSRYKSKSIIKNLHTSDKNSLFVDSIKYHTFTFLEIEIERVSTCTHIVRFEPFNLRGKETCVFIFLLFFLKRIVSTYASTRTLVRKKQKNKNS